MISDPQIELESMHTKKRYVFNCGRWLAEDEDDGCIIREIPAEGEDIKKPQPCENIIDSCMINEKMK